MTTETERQALLVDREKVARYLCCGGGWCNAEDHAQPRHCWALKLFVKDADKAIAAVRSADREAGQDPEAIRRAALEEAAQIAEDRRVHYLLAHNASHLRGERDDLGGAWRCAGEISHAIRALADQPAAPKASPVAADQLEELLNNLPEPSPELRRLLTTPSPWDTTSTVAPSDAEVESAARAYNPVGWAWYDGAPDDHPAKPIFRTREFAQMGRAITALRAMDRERGLVTVPREPTEAMLRASRSALSEYIASLPQEQRDKFKGRDGGYHVDFLTKAAARWRAMIEAHEREAGQ